MQQIAEYLKWAKQCRDMAARSRLPSDKKAFELMAAAWDRAADQRKKQLAKEEAQNRS